MERPVALQMNNAGLNQTDTHALDVLETLNRRVLTSSLTVLAFAMPLISGVLIAGAIRSHSLTPQVAIASSTMVVFPIMRLSLARLGFHRAAFFLVACLAGSAFLLSTRGILTVGYAAVCVLAIQLSALFFRRKGAMLALTAVVALHVLGWIVVVNGFSPGLVPQFSDPTNSTTWFRQLVILIFLGMVIALGQLYVIEQLAQSLAVHRDLAEREKAQRLALEDAERAQAQQHEQRTQAQLAVERSRRIEALARVAGGVAHDFNNALTVILGAAEAAKEESRSPEDLEAHMDGIIEAARHAAALTNQLLTLGRQQLSSPVNASITALLARIRPAFGRVLPADVLLTVDMPIDDITIRVDETSLDRALLNLVLNARDAMPCGGTITLSCRRDIVGANDSRLAAGSYLALQVIDDGAGMDRETLDRVFDPFFTTKGDKGTGLGLASVYAFAREAGGGVDVVSTLGRGTTFTMWLPEAADAEAVPSSDAVAPAPAAARFSDRLLIVEDLAEVRTMMKRVLAMRGFDVSLAASGDEALAILETGERFALMCIDGVMPGLSTAATIDRARALAPEMRVIVCSGHIQEDLLRRGIETGRYELIPKPFTSLELVTRISHALEQAPAPSPDNAI